MSFLAKNPLGETPKQGGAGQIAPPPMLQAAPPGAIETLGKTAATRAITPDINKLVDTGVAHLGGNQAAIQAASAQQGGVLTGLGQSAGLLSAPTASTAIAGGGSAAGAGVATAGFSAGLAAAAPWLVGGYFGGKAVGLFNDGGPIPGPLSAESTTTDPKAYLNMQVRKLMDSGVSEAEALAKVQAYAQQYMNMGGPVKNTYNDGGAMANPNSHPGAPVGPDTVPIWATPGEFMMNKEATNMFKPEIQQMNNLGLASRKY